MVALGAEFLAQQLAVARRLLPVDGAMIEAGHIVAQRIELRAVALLLLDLDADQGVGREEAGPPPSAPPAHSAPPAAAAVPLRAADAAPGPAVRASAATAARRWRCRAAAASAGIRADRLLPGPSMATRWPGSGAAARSDIAAPFQPHRPAAERLARSTRQRDRCRRHRAASADRTAAGSARRASPSAHRSPAPARPAPHRTSAPAARDRRSSTITSTASGNAGGEQQDGAERRPDHRGAGTWSRIWPTTLSASRPSISRPAPARGGGAAPAAPAS